jgi:hypothetical protein
MHSDDLTTAQAKVIYDQMRPFVAYLTRLKARMDKRGFAIDDPLYKLVDETHSKAQHLLTDLHYRSCASGVHRRPGK